jgi:ABC-type nickel/cobalt efflux system permease component RcnA
MGQADHFHIGGGHHHHHHDHDHDHHHDHDHAHHTHGEGGEIIPNTPAKTSMWEIMSLGFMGGMVPCGEALFLLVYAISKGVAHLALPLVLAFSAGLATVLVVIGIMVVSAKRAASQAASDSPGLRKVARALPIVSAVGITLIGLWLCYGVIGPK